MKCLNCNGNIVILRNILNIFSLKKEYICKNCFKDITFEPNEIVLPVNNYLIKIYYLVIETNKFKYESLINEYSKIYNLLNTKTKLLLTYDKYYMSKQNYIFFEDLANHHQMDINILVTELLD